MQIFSSKRYNIEVLNTFVGEVPCRCVREFHYPSKRH